MGFACIYLIEYRYDLNENLFLKKVIGMPIIFGFLKTLQQNLTLNYGPVEVKRLHTKTFLDIIYIINVGVTLSSHFGTV